MKSCMWACIQALPSPVTVPRFFQRIIPVSLQAQVRTPLCAHESSNHHETFYHTLQSQAFHRGRFHHQSALSVMLFWTMYERKKRSSLSRDVDFTSEEKRAICSRNLKETFFAEVGLHQLAALPHAHRSVKPLSWLASRISNSRRGSLRTRTRVGLAGLRRTDPEPGMPGRPLAEVDHGKAARCVLTGQGHALSPG